MNYNKTLIIAEAGVNHNGDYNTALKLCLAAKEAGADVVKFQTWKTEKLITQNVKQAEYQTANTGVEESQYEMLKKLELSYDEFRKIKNYCDEIGIIFASTADEEESLDFLVSLGLPFIKIGSGDVGNIPYLRKIGGIGLPIIMSTGMSTLADIEISLDILKEGGAKDISVLHCTTNYPCPYEDVNLNAMITMKHAFNLPVGYSDHTIGCSVSTAAVAMGATIIEKHFTLDKNMEGPDHLASTNPTEFKELVQSIRQVESAIGNGEKKPCTSEREISKVVTKRIVAKTNILKGEELSDNNICVKRNDVGLSVKYWDLVIGSKAIKDYELDEGIILYES